MKTDDLLDQVNEQVLALMETAGRDWIKPWAYKQTNNPAINVVSKNAYTGINSWITNMAPYIENIWGTYKQWMEKGAPVKKGEKSTAIIWASNFTPKAEQSKPADKQHKAFCYKVYHVFNIEQTGGYAPRADLFEDHEPAHIDHIEQAEKFCQRTGAVIKHRGNSAFYAPGMDLIQIPYHEAFHSTDGYYSTLLHELTHWTGAKTRLNRKFGGKFGDTGYAREELVAEIGAAQLCALLGVTSEPREDHAKYLNNWITVLKSDNKALTAAFSQAGKATKYLESLQVREAAAA